ncbi:MAG: nuclear transport factor 2 family protein [Bacteroidota bacterium]
MKRLYPSFLVYSLLLGLFFLISACGEDTIDPDFNCEIPPVWYADTDGDGFGDPSNPIKNCDSIPGFVQNFLDLDDTQSGIDTVSNETKVRRFLAALGSGDTTVLEFVSDDDFVQHNPFIEDGKAGLQNLINGTATGIVITIHRFFSDGNAYITHSTYGGTWNGGTPQVVFDVFAFDNGIMVEHWDNLIDEVSAGAVTQTSGPTSINEPDQTNANRLMIENMSSDVLLRGLDTTYSIYFSDIANYVQHGVGANPAVSSFSEALANMTGGIRDFVEFKYVNGEFALVLSEATQIMGMDTSQNAHYDLFRIEEDLIVEHWEVVQKIPTEGLANDNGKW